MGAQESVELLGRALVGRIATVGPDGFPYITPMNFVYDSGDQTIFLHCATTGHLLDNLAHSPRACFEIDEPEEIIATGPTACDTSHAYRSVICFGEAQAIPNESARSRALELFVDKYVNRLMPERRYDREMTMAQETEVIAFQVSTMTGKRRMRP